MASQAAIDIIDTALQNTINLFKKFSGQYNCPQPFLSNNLRQSLSISYARSIYYLGNRWVLWILVLQLLFIIKCIWLYSDLIVKSRLRRLRNGWWYTKERFFDSWYWKKPPNQERWIIMMLQLASISSLRVNIRDTQPYLYNEKNGDRSSRLMVII